jgi:predicted RNase H-like nuclease
LTTSSDTLVAGVDGCPAGWLVVLLPVGHPGQASATVVSSFAEILTLEASPSIIAIDIPIGLPDRTMPGGRLADIEARARLGERQSAVFAVPARAAVAETDYLSACAISARLSDPPRRMSKQTFNLFPKIREVDLLMAPALQDRVFESHPEAAFWAMNGQRPLALAKKVKSRPFEPGLELRRKLLESAGYPRKWLTDRHFRPSVAGPDDLLDACACAWTAARLAMGKAVRFPAAEPDRDMKNLRMEIWG